MLTFFKVMKSIGEYSWESVSGPFETYEEALRSKNGWFKPEEIPSMRVVQFY